MDNKVQNVKQPVLPDENSFNDEDILQDVLISLKHLSTEYGLLKEEASHKGLVSKIDPIAKEISQMARDSFNLMFEKGWYVLEKQTPQKLNEEYNKFNQKLGQL